MRLAGICACPLSTGLLAAALSLPLAVVARADIAISIDKSSQQMSVAVDGQQRYIWPVSTGRPGYDTPNGSFKPNRMDADHFSQEWDNAPMPHTIFFDLHGHAIHGFFDVKHLGLAVSHGCVRLSPEHAATLFDLVKTEGMAKTSVTIAGRTPGGDNGPVARQRLPENEMVYSNAPVQTAPQYQPQPYAQQPYAARTAIPGPAAIRAAAVAISAATAAVLRSACLRPALLRPAQLRPAAVLWPAILRAARLSAVVAPALIPC